jgi:hypothetical protein
MGHMSTIGHTQTIHRARDMKHTHRETIHRARDINTHTDQRTHREDTPVRKVKIIRSVVPRFDTRNLAC